MKHRFAYLDVLRLLAVMLVMFGHYVSVAGGATEIPGIINIDTALPASLQAVLKHLNKQSGVSLISPEHN